jgi:hypothetical protein
MALTPAEIVVGGDGACHVLVGPRGYVLYVPACLPFSGTSAMNAV